MNSCVFLLVFFECVTGVCVCECVCECVCVRVCVCSVLHCLLLSMHEPMKVYRLHHVPFMSVCKQW